MKIEKVELVNIPEIGEHKIMNAKIQPINASDVQEGELILFGYHLMKVVFAKIITGTKDSNDAFMFNMKALNLSSGIVQAFALPPSTIFQRVIEANYEVNSPSGWEGYQSWKRMRHPILGERTICGACGGECEELKQHDIDGFEAELKGEKAQCGGLIKTYDKELDCFLSYDGCEEPTRG